MYRVIQGNILRFAAHYKGPFFDAVLCDPPYELGLMGSAWDSSRVSFHKETWAAIASLLLPGAHLMIFGGARTFHRIAVAVEDAGLEIRDVISWVYAGNSMPKGVDVSKAIDKHLGLEREVIGTKKIYTFNNEGNIYRDDNYKPDIEKLSQVTAPVSDLAQAWDGYNTALIPAWEPVILARVPFKSSVAENIIYNGTGALNIDACRIPANGEKLGGGSTSGSHADHAGWRRPWMESKEALDAKAERSRQQIAKSERLGRWPKNFIHDDSDQVKEAFGKTNEQASRFFYSPKASQKERSGGLSGRNPHPTVKPIALTQYLATLILPPSRVGQRKLLVPFCGSGSEMIGALNAGWDWVVGVELQKEYAETARQRLKYYHE